MRQSFLALPPEQLAFVFSGKRYLLARLALQIILIVCYVLHVRGGDPFVTPLSAAGAALVIGGYAVRRWARATLGERFRGFEVRAEPAGVESRGPYALIRHPGYLGLALMDIGWPLLLSLPWGVVLSAALVALIIQRIAIEERLLTTTYAEYARFAATRKRLIPGVW